MTFFTWARAFRIRSRRRRCWRSRRRRRSSCQRASGRRAECHVQDFLCLKRKGKLLEHSSLNKFFTFNQWEKMLFVKKYLHNPTNLFFHPLNGSSNLLKVHIRLFLEMSIGLLLFSLNYVFSIFLFNEIMDTNAHSLLL